MDDVLNKMTNIKGVSGVFISNYRGMPVAYSEGLELALVKRLTNEIKENLILNKKISTHLPERLQFDYDSATIIVQFIQIGFVVILCEPGMVNALLRLSLNVIFLQMKTDPAIQEKIVNAIPM